MTFQDASNLARALRIRKNKENFPSKLMTTFQRLVFPLAMGLSTALTTTRALAQDFLGPVPDYGGADVDEGDLRVTVLDILGKILMFMALVAVIFIVIAGIRLVVSQGDEGEKDKAKKTIIYVIVGLIVIILASAIVSFVEDTLLG